MTEVTFHVNVERRLEYVCLLLRRAVNQRLPVRVLGARESLQALDEALWAWGATEFIAHAWADADSATVAASCVLLSDQMAAPVHSDCRLLNLGDDVPQGFEAYSRVIEVVGTAADERERARSRWRYYQSLGCVPRHYDAAS